MNLVIHDLNENEWEKIADGYNGWEVISDQYVLQVFREHADELESLFNS